MGVAGGSVRGARRPSHVAYYVALAGILGLLLLVCCYFFYYFVSKVKELRHDDSLIQPTRSVHPPRPVPAAKTTAYPVRPVVRDGASAMAKLCKQLPAPPQGKGDTVFPTSTSPAAQQTDTGDATLPDKIPASAAHPITVDLAAR